MVKAFVFGKFLPFHKGHEAMIRFALDHCDSLTVLVCCSDQELYAGVLRQKWIKDTFPEENKLNIISYKYREDELPNTSESSEGVSRIWAGVFQSLVGDCSLLVTSEPYGTYVAAFMGIRHLSFDPDRRLVPVSGTAIRADMRGNWHFLASGTKPFFARKVAILGTESTGKTTLSRQLAEYYGSQLVSEVARSLIPDSKQFAFEDLSLVAAAHAYQIEQAIQADNGWLVILDTDVHLTCSYARFVFDQKLPVADHIWAANRADVYLYLNNDVPYVQDGTRLSEDDRNRLDLSHRAVLGEHGILFQEISGTWEERFNTACSIIDNLLQLPY